MGRVSRQMFRITDWCGSQGKAWELCWCCKRTKELGGDASDVRNRTHCVASSCAVCCVALVSDCQDTWLAAAAWLWPLQQKGWVGLDFMCRGKSVVKVMTGCVDESITENKWETLPFFTNCVYELAPTSQSNAFTVMILCSLIQPHPSSWNLDSF